MYYFNIFNIPLDLHYTNFIELNSPRSIKCMANNVVSSRTLHRMLSSIS